MKQRARGGEEGQSDGVHVLTPNQQTRHVFEAYTGEPAPDVETLARDVEM